MGRNCYMPENESVYKVLKNMNIPYGNNGQLTADVNKRKSKLVKKKTIT